MLIPLSVASNKELTDMHLGILTMFHKISGQELAVLSALITEYLNLNDKLDNKEQCLKIVFSTEYKKAYRTNLKLTTPRLQNILYSLRKKGLLTGSTISKSLIPDKSTPTSKIYFNITLKE